MILPDVNVLIYAFRADFGAPLCLQTMARPDCPGRAQFGLSPLALSAVARIATNSRVFQEPSPVEEGLRFLRQSARSAALPAGPPGPRHWSIFTRICLESDIRGPRISDSWFAALAIEHGCVVDHLRSRSAVAELVARPSLKLATSAQKLKAARADSGGPTRTPSNSSMPSLRRRAAGRGEAADFAAGGQDPVTGNDQGRRIAGHRLADVARRLAAGADLLRQRAVGGRAAPADPAQGGVDPAEEWRPRRRGRAGRARSPFPRRQSTVSPPRRSPQLFGGAQALRQ